MDSITQALLGAAIGESLLGKKVGNKGALIGAAVATIPDLDVMLYLFYDKLDMLSIHRGFSHSILFSILGAILIAFFLNKIKGLQHVGFKSLLLLSWLSLFTHILLDTFTAYGTQIFSPFSDKRVGFDSINVIDPLYTAPLLIGLLLSLWVFKSSGIRSKFTKYGLVISSIYLVFTLINKEIVKTKLEKTFSSQNIEFDALLTMPVGIANIHWYGIAKGKDSLFMLKHSILNQEDHPIETFPINENYLNQIDEKIANKMRWFAKGFYTVEKVNDKIRIYNLQVDMRGIVKDGEKKAPTVGYFEVATINGRSELSSGSIQ